MLKSLQLFQRETTSYTPVHTTLTEPSWTSARSPIHFEVLARHNCVVWFYIHFNYLIVYHVVILYFSVLLYLL